jgi:CubicO group peptidase (beta-lactamase class C family)
MQQTVDQKQLSGIVTLLARHGRVIDYRAYGHKDMTTGAPMTKDAIFRDFSMTKPVTAVAMMILYEQGGYIIEKLSGQSLPEFMEQRFFKPLRMRDAGFFVPGNKRSRFVTLYRANPNGELVADGTPGSPADYAEQPAMASGGGGMVSTAEDYYRFAQMLGNGGELGGTRVLAPSSVHLMSSNHLPPSLLTGEFGIGLQILRPGFGYGYNCAVVFDPPQANLPEGKDIFFWDGAAGTWFWVDPTNDVVFVGMIQRLLGPSSPPLEFQSRSVVYQALVKPKT